MGNQDSCCSCKSTQLIKVNQIEARSESIADLKEENQQKEYTTQNVIQNIGFSIRNPIFLENNSRVRNQLSIQKITNTIQSQQDQQKVKTSKKQGVNNQNQDEKQFMSNQKSSKIKNYISLKRSTPRNHYKFLRILSSTQNSHVYEAINIKNGYKKAIKVKKVKEKEKCNQLGTIKSESKMFLQESLDHPNIVRLYQVYQHQGNQYLVMEIMQGGPLSKILSCKSFKEANNLTNVDGFFQQLEQIIKQVLYALCYLHEKEIAHLNIQPNNILLSHQFGKKNKQCAKLVAFSSALNKITNSLSPIQKLYLTHLNDRHLLPPEIIQTKGVCLKTDIWMLGITLFQVITGKKLQTPNHKYGHTNFHSIREEIQRQWKLIQKQLQFFQSHCLDLILKMVEIDAIKRPTPWDCLEHPWFLPLDLDQSDQNINRKSRSILRQTVLTKKPNNLINYIENVIIYKNISQREMQFISQIFMKFDKDKNGSVQIQQIISFFQNQCQSKQDSLFQFCLQLINNLDNDDSGTIDYHQFCKGFINRRMHITKSAIEEIFNHMDLDGNGKIVLHQLKNSLQGYDLSELQHYMKQIDTNFDGYLTKTQFIQYCLMKFQENWEVEHENSSQVLPFSV